MTRILLGVVVVVLSGCNCKPQCPEMPDAAIATPQPWGGPCLQQSDCQQGLTCLPYLRTLAVCTYPCSTNAECHGGACTIDGDAGSCSKPCEVDGGCETGDIFSSCANNSCIPLTCTFGVKDTCPSGLACVGASCIEDDFGYGITSGLCRGVMR